jgi:hypothetical protein
LREAQELRELTRALLGGQPLAVLATHGPGGAHACLVAFAFTEDLAQLLLATPRATRKFENLGSDRRVALLVDNRRNRESDFREAAAATVFGFAEEVPEAEREPLLALYLQRHPHLKEFATSPATALLRVEVEKYSLVTRFQEVEELRMARG